MLIVKTILFRIVSQCVSIKFLKKILFSFDFSVCLHLWTSPFLYCFLQNTHIMKPVSMHEGSLKRPINKGFNLKNLTKTIGLKIGIKKDRTFKIPSRTIFRKTESILISLSGDVHVLNRSAKYHFKRSNLFDPNISELTIFGNRSERSTKNTLKKQNIYYAG